MTTPSTAHTVLPQVSDDQIAADLRWLTELLETTGAQLGGGLLGGRYGYGAYAENDTFVMHPYCWCEKPECAWCAGCECADEAHSYELAGRAVTADEFYAAGGYRAGTSTVNEDLQCAFCRGGGRSAPNFLHKASGSTVSWYKYLGRGMAVDLSVPWRDLFGECVAAITAATNQTGGPR